MSRLFAYRATAAGIARRSQQRGSVPAIMDSEESKRALVGSPVAGKVIYLRRQTVVRDLNRMPTANEFSRARHLAFLASIRIATSTPLPVLIDRIAAWHGLTYADLIRKSRFRHIVLARDDAIAAVYALKKPGDRFSLSFPALGRIFGGMDHTSIMASLRRTAKRGPA